jgi:hypothetical protein
MSPITKVDRVCSAEEARKLQDLGVDIISVDLESDKKFSDNRYISENIAYDIYKVLTSTKYCASLSLADRNLPILKNNCFDYLQFSRIEEPTACIESYLKECKIDLIYSGIEISYEDDLSWIENSLQDKIVLNTTLFQVDLLSDMDNSWEFLKHKSPEYPEELLQIEDINKLSSRFPLIIEIDFTSNNILEIMHCFPEIKGMNFRLGANPLRNDLHFIDFDKLVNTLSIIK